ncbi:MAG TPA: hypothetical protein DHV36_03830 [Desulfobacteraceae bacterium]|nr:hypothetical protein [Desulfobacteraceae bacterium]
MEFVCVTFEDQRDVYVDGVQTARTNETFRVEEGRHQFDLGLPPDYDPPEMRLTVTGTTPIKPLAINFSKP